MSALELLRLENKGKREPWVSRWVIAEQLPPRIELDNDSWLFHDALACFAHGCRVSIDGPDSFECPKRPGSLKPGRLPFKLVGA